GVARRSDRQPGAPGVLPVRADRPAAPDRERHRRLVAAQVPVNLGRILLLLVLVAGLGTYLYVYEVPKAEREGKKEKLVAVDKDAVTGIRLVYPDREIELHRDDGTWKLVRPVQAPAEDAAVKGILGTITDAE